MENATKALIIAGGMLIAMLIVGLLTWGYTQLRSLQKTNVEEEERQQIVDFNERFEAYNKKVVRGYQMISLANLVSDTNTRFAEDDGYAPVTIEVNGLSSEKAEGEDLVNYIQTYYDTMSSNEKNALKQLYFECYSVDYDSKNSRVKKMFFRRVNVDNNKGE